MLYCTFDLVGRHSLKFLRKFGRLSCCFFTPFLFIKYFLFVVCIKWYVKIHSNMWNTSLIKAEKGMVTVPSTTLQWIMKPRSSETDCFITKRSYLRKWVDLSVYFFLMTCFHNISVCYKIHVYLEGKFYFSLLFPIFIKFMLVIGICHEISCIVIRLYFVMVVL